MAALVAVDLFNHLTLVAVVVELAQQVEQHLVAVDQEVMEELDLRYQ